MCNTCVQEIVSDPAAPNGGNVKSASKDKLRLNPKVQVLLRELDAQRQPDGTFLLHPKMEMLKTLLIQHFASSASEDNYSEEATSMKHTQETRAMVFVTNRGCVDEIEEFLTRYSPLIRPKRFIGQGADKQGKKGFAQKEQLDVSAHIGLLNTMSSRWTLDHPKV